MGPSSLPMLYRSGAQAVDQVQNTSLQAHLGRIHSWSHSTAGLGMNSCRRSRPDAMYRAHRIVTGGKSIGRAAQDGVQHLQTAFSSPGAYAPGGLPAMEGGLTTPTSSHRNWTSKGGHVNPNPAHPAPPAGGCSATSRSSKLGSCSNCASRGCTWGGASRAATNASHCTSSS
jgi:hypothetical protein